MIYLFHGENDFAISRRAEQLVVEFSAKHGENSVSRMDCEEVKPSDLISELVNVNIFSPIRLILLKNLEKNSEAWSTFGDNLDRIADDTHVIAVATLPDKRTRTYKTLLTSAKVQEFKRLRGRELSDWLMTELEARRIEFKRSAIDELINATSEDQWRLINEISKLESLSQVISSETVRQYVEPDLESNAFTILDYAMTGRRELALDELNRLKQSEDPNKFFGLLSSQFFALVAAVFVTDKSQAATDLKIHPFQLSKMGDLARKLGDRSEQKQRLRATSSVLSKMDAKIKLSRPDEAWSFIEITIATI